MIAPIAPPRSTALPDASEADPEPDAAEKQEQGDPAEERAAQRLDVAARLGG